MNILSKFTASPHRALSIQRAPPHPRFNIYPPKVEDRSTHFILGECHIFRCAKFAVSTKFKFSAQWFPNKRFIHRIITYVSNHSNQTFFQTHIHIFPIQRFFVYYLSDWMNYTFVYVKQFRIKNIICVPRKRCKFSIFVFFWSVTWNMTRFMNFVSKYFRLLHKCFRQNFTSHNKLCAMHSSQRKLINTLHKQSTSKTEHTRSTCALLIFPTHPHKITP